ncbi:hypothetical protein ABZV64_20630 [Streptomyces sp. NPDC004959]|uniref:hypothetical protein n=1 Tax=unclassified Streptomyces TaxID=2593676 RepID=UPI0033BF2C40
MATAHGTAIPWTPLVLLALVARTVAALRLPRHRKRGEKARKRAAVARELRKREEKAG